jgi:uncharacterized membrane protein YhiD involved in acid resistance
MDDLLRSLNLPAGPVIWLSILVNIGIAFLLGLLIVAIYRLTHRQMTVSFSFVTTLIAICMIMSMVIMVIGDNIARAFGLAGAMSIVRFRTVVKDTRDTAFVFYAIGTGMAAGTGNLKLALIGTPLIGLLLAVLHWTRHGTSEQEAHLLSFENESIQESEREAYAEAFRRHLEDWSLVITRSVRAGTGIHYTFRVRLRSGARPQDMIRDLSAIEGVVRAQISLGEELEPVM